MSSDKINARSFYFDQFFFVRSLIINCLVNFPYNVGKYICNIVKQQIASFLSFSFFYFF